LNTVGGLFLETPSADISAGSAPTDYLADEERNVF
jgi:hypothetical protein